MKKTQGIITKRKFSIMSKVRENPNGPIHILKIMFLSLPLILVSLLLSYSFTINSIGDGAYKYSEDAYAQIKTAIESSVIKDVGLDTLNLQKQVSKYTFTYENNQSVLSCSVINGFFEANITCEVSKNYSITTTNRNFNSLEEYMSYYWQVFSVYLFGIALLLFIIFNLCIFGGLYFYALLSNYFAQKKQEKVVDDVRPSDSYRNDTPALHAMQEGIAPQINPTEAAPVAMTEPKENEGPSGEEKLPDAS